MGTALATTLLLPPKWSYHPVKFHGKWVSLEVVDQEKMRMLSVFMPYSVDLRTPVPACTDFIPPLAEVLSSGWRVPSEVLAEVAAEEGAVDVETKHTCVPGHACSLLRHYSLPSAS